jgi:hypothetical protein
MTYTSSCLEDSFHASPQDNSALGQTSNSAGGILENGWRRARKLNIILDINHNHQILLRFRLSSANALVFKETLQLNHPTAS